MTGKELVLAENGELPVLPGDSLIAMADMAEKRVAAMVRIKQAALAITSPNDWIDQNGKPYLSASGSEKIARLFGISWRIDEPEFVKEEDGHFSYSYKGYFSVWGATIEAIGSRGSKDPFFSKAHGKDIPPLEIDRNDVKKAAYTNLLGNGITRILGLRGLTWDDLKATNIDKSKVDRVEYEKKEMSEEAKELRKKIGDMLLEMAGGDKEKAGELLSEYTAFTAKDGSIVLGKTSLADLTEKAMKPTYGRVKKAYEAWRGEVQEVEPSQDKLID
ncbi:MAG: hypothetical protein DDT19_00083 [Syntrophomonadaceae bacterium]|nr:hypothetical protein [Bacillota bacterium]